VKVLDHGDSARTLNTGFIKVAVLLCGQKEREEIALRLKGGTNNYTWVNHRHKAVGAVIAAT